MLVFHGNPSTPDAVLRASRMNPVADKNGFLVAYPANPGRWDAARDTAFVEALIDQVIEEWGADPQRVHAAGFSAGAELIYDLSHTMPGRFGSVAPVSGWTTEIEPMRAPPSLITFQGEDDPAYDRFASINAAWHNAAGCGEVHSEHISNTAGEADRSAASCDDEAEHVIYTVIDMGHSWPTGIDSGYPVNASELIWEFFANHPLP